MRIRGTAHNRGYVQVYTGNGKGKTTAAIGLAIRAIGAGLNVYIAQFMKNGDTSEIKILKQHTDRMKIEHFFVQNDTLSYGRQATGSWSERIQEIYGSMDYQVVVLEEANMAVACRFFSVQILLDIIACKPESVELVITGRNAHPKVIEMADLVTEMKEVKHYFHSGVMARMGIEM